MGIDPTLSSNQITRQGFRLISGYYPWEMPDNVSFDVIVLLAVIEHFPPDQYVSVAQGCVQHLRPGGKLIITVPGPKVDPILFVLVKLGIVHGMSLEEHHGFQPDDTPKIFSEPDFRLIEARRFQLGLNHLFVFERS
jgi:SAM-dependent methyltransferase